MNWKPVVDGTPEGKQILLRTKEGEIVIGKRVIQIPLTLASNILINSNSVTFYSGKDLSTCFHVGDSELSIMTFESWCLIPGDET